MARFSPERGRGRYAADIPDAGWCHVDAQEGTAPLSNGDAPRPITQSRSRTGSSWPSCVLPALAPFSIFSSWSRVCTTDGIESSSQFVSQIRPCCRRLDFSGGKWCYTIGRAAISKCPLAGAPLRFETTMMGGRWTIPATRSASSLPTRHAAWSCPRRLHFKGIQQCVDDDQ